MRALLSLRPGGPESLVVGDIELPGQVPDGHVRVSIKACAVNYPDVLMIADRYQRRPTRPFAPGMDIAGFVDAVGPGIAHLSPGDRVMAQLLQGGLAEKVDVTVARCLAIPGALPFDEAAAMLTTHGTARYALQDCGRLVPGETVLVLGAAGGVGLAAVELARCFGARVVAAVSSPEKAAVATSCGADGIVVYTAGPLDLAASKGLAAELRNACGPGGANVIVDVVGGDYAEAAMRTIAPGGRYLVIGFAAGIPRLPLNLVLLNRASVLGVAWSADLGAEPDWLRRQLKKLIELHSVGKIRPRISRRFTLERAAEAIACLADRRAIGKIIVEP